MSPTDSFSAVFVLGLDFVALERELREADSFPGFEPALRDLEARAARGLVVESLGSSIGNGLASGFGEEVGGDADAEVFGLTILVAAVLSAAMGLSLCDLAAAFSLGLGSCFGARSDDVDTVDAAMETTALVSEAVGLSFTSFAAAFCLGFGFGFRAESREADGLRALAFLAPRGFCFDLDADVSRTS